MSKVQASNRSAEDFADLENSYHVYSNTMTLKTRWKYLLLLFRYYREVQTVNRINKKLQKLEKYSKETHIRWNVLKLSHTLEKL